MGYTQFLKEIDDANKSQRAQSGASSTPGTPSRNHFRNASSPTGHRWRNQHQSLENQPLLRRRSLGPRGEDNDPEVAQPVAGGTVLGIHNLAIVMPQFVVSSITSIGLSGCAYEFAGCDRF